MAVEASGRRSRLLAHGLPRAEVFSVVVRLNNPGGKLYGTITVTDPVRRQYIYNRERDESDSGSAALLIETAQVICAFGSFGFEVDLMNDIKGVISWDFYNPSSVYDRLLQETVSGENGSAIVNYAVFRNAVEATVEVTLFDGDGNDPACVYGQITARNTNFTNESTLFQKTLDETGRVSPGEHIPLLKSAVAVPLSSSLIVGANLFVHNGYERESEREIAKGTAEFPAQSSGTFEKDIGAKHGMIRVKVAWTIYI